MRKLFLIFLLLSLSFSVNSLNKNDCLQVYKNLIIKNNIIGAPTIKYLNNNKEEAYNNGKEIGISKGMLRKLGNRQELAFTLSHEIAHMNSKGNQSNYLNEHNADIDGALLDKKAGYNPCRGRRLFLKFLDASTDDHPSSMWRYNSIQCK